MNQREILIMIMNYTHSKKRAKMFRCCRTHTKMTYESNYLQVYAKIIMIILFALRLMHSLINHCMPFQKQMAW